MSHLRCPDNGKIGYLDEHDAQRALNRAQHVRRKAYTARRYAKGREGVIGATVSRQERRPYECDCGLWHLTSQRERVDVSVFDSGGWEA